MPQNQKFTAGAAVGIIVFAVGVLGWQWKRSSASERPMTLAAPKEAAMHGSSRAGEGEGMPDPRMLRDKMAQDLGLSADQQTKMADAQKGMIEKMRPLFDDKKMPAEEKMKRMQAIMQTMQSNMKSILTPEQQQKMQSMMPPMPGMGGGGMPPIMGGMGMPSGGVPNGSAFTIR